MTVSLLPRVIADKITDLTAERLHGMCVELLIMDFDNTIVPYTTDIPTDEVVAWLEEMKKSGIRLCVVSNSKRDRVKIFCKKYGLDCITHARKPFSKGIRQCLQQFRTDPNQAALVGDQIYTDTLGGNCAGVTSILVNAIDNHTFWLKLRHVAEKPFIYAARKRRLTYEEH